MSNWQARELDLPLSFLGAGRYRAEIYADANDAELVPKHVQIFTQRVRSQTHLKLRFAPGGGCTARFFQP